MPAQTVQTCLKNEDVLPAMSQDHTSMSQWVTLGWTPSTHQGSPTASQHARTQPWPVFV